MALTDAMADVRECQRGLTVDDVRGREWLWRVLEHLWDEWNDHQESWYAICR